MTEWLNAVVTDYGLVCIVLIYFFHVLCSAEDADMAELPENKRQRYVTLSLGALSLVVTSLSKQQVEAISPRVEELLQDGRFWKLAKDKADSVSCETSTW
jgi:hypothetical protein